jgi:hypothetical protein
MGVAGEGGRLQQRNRFPSSETSGTSLTIHRRGDFVKRKVSEFAALVRSLLMLVSPSAAALTSGR